MSVTPNTEYWLDLYTALLAQLHHNTNKPQEWFDRLGITNEAGVVATPRSASMESIHESEQAWQRVRRSIKVFGLELNDHLDVKPQGAYYAANPTEIPRVGQARANALKELQAWSADPWIELRHDFELIPLRFKGRDAMSAASFFAYWHDRSQSNDDPREATKKILLEQGINAENFHLHSEQFMIKNPWA